MNLRLACVRLDRIGDLLCTLPVTSMAPEGSVTWFISTGLGFIPEHSLKPLSYFEMQKKWNWRQFLTFYRQLKKENYHMIVCFHSPWWVSFAAWLAGVPLRVGVLSQWHSFLFLNRGLRQKRSESLQHESTYNRDLFSYALTSMGIKPAPPLDFWPLQSSSLEGPRLNELFKTPFYVVHPGMGGSAMNWPMSSYRELILQLLKRHIVVITGTSMDRLSLDQLRDEFEHHPQIRWLENQLTPPQLLKVLQKAEGVIAPSTGVAHLAASLKSHVIGLYPPIKVQSSLRWAARGPRAHILSPQRECPAYDRCLKEKCPYFNCMFLVTVDQVVKEMD